MSLSLSRRAARTVQSEIRAMSIACEKVHGINLAQGVCDTEVPLPVRQGAKQAMDHGINSYTRAEGLAPILEEFDVDALWMLCPCKRVWPLEPD